MGWLWALLRAGGRLAACAAGQHSGWTLGCWWVWTECRLGGAIVLHHLFVAVTAGLPRALEAREALRPHPVTECLSLHNCHTLDTLECELHCVLQAP